MRGDAILWHDGKSRCAWVPADDDAAARYHDEVWGTRTYEESAMFEALTLGVFEVGLSWSIVFGKRDAFRTAFRGFDVATVAAMTGQDVDRLVQDASIIRNHGKIQATVDNARAMMTAAPSLATLAKSYATTRKQAPMSTADLPKSTPQAEAFAKQLKSLGYRYVGPTSVYAFMQNVGVVNDHIHGCFRAADYAAEPAHGASLSEPGSNGYCPGIGSLTTGMVGAGLSSTSCWASRLKSFISNGPGRLSSVRVRGERLHDLRAPLMLLKWVADRLAPERRGGRVRQLLPDGPASREASEQGRGRLRPGSTAPVLAHHKKLGDVARLSGKDQGEAGQRALDPEQERLAVRVGPVLVEVPVQVLPVRIDVTAVELGEIVVIQLKQPPDDGPVVLERLDHLYVHPLIMPAPPAPGRPRASAPCSWAV
jgi:DNA-3-methyladenine glycosylase I